MKILIFICTLFVITSCYDKETETKQFGEAMCNVEHDGFTYISTVINSTQTSFNIKANQIKLDSPQGNMTLNLSTNNKLSYRGSKDIGTLSYTSPEANSPIELGAIGYLCWSGLRTNFKNKISFEENLKKI